ncbi:MAG: HEAT repeat domain-containing protein [Pirellula sp.]
MEINPIDYSPEHQLWALECQARLEHALDPSIPDSESPRRLQWNAPDEWLPTLLLAERICQWESVERDSLASLSDHRKALLLEALSTLGNWLCQLSRTSTTTFEDQTAKLVQLMVSQRAFECYRAFRRYEPSKCLGLFLQAMFLSGHSSSLRLAVDLLVESPPGDWKDSAHGLSTLMQSTDWKLADVFPRILDTQNPSVLAPALDLANSMVRKHGVTPHPAACKFESLLNVFGAVTMQLQALEENPRKFSDSVQVIQRILFDAVSLLVACCDSFALIGDPRAIGKLNQAIELRHRRIKLEAAYALVKLGETRALDLIAELLQDDSSRSRAIAYLQELSAEDRIGAEWTSSLAKAKSDLAIWLSQPEQFAIPPSKIELIEQRTMHWPGFEGPQECFLLQFDYGTGDGNYSNVGFAGPFASAMGLDIKSLSNDAAFAMYLANDVQDDSESRVDWESLTGRQKDSYADWLDALGQKGFEQIEPLARLRTLGNEGLLCQGRTGDGSLWGILTDGDSVIRCPAGAQTFETLFLQWKGKLALAILGEE